MKLALLIVLLSVGIQSAFSQDGANYVRKGNKEFKKGNFYEAELEYRKAIQQEENSTKAQFNLGDALFRQEKYDEALKNFGALSERTDAPPELKASSLYNLGNSFFKQQHYRESVEAYKQALRLEPGAKDIKYNLSAALRKLQQQENQQNQNKDQNQQQNKDQQNQDQKNGGGEGDDQKNQDQNQQGNKDQNNDKGQQQQQNQEQGKEQQNKDQSQQKQQQGNEEQQKKNDKGAAMSQEDAAQLLKALENQESALQAKVQKAKAKVGAKKKTDKDW